MHLKILVITDGIMPSYREMEMANVVLRKVGVEGNTIKCIVERHPKMKQGDEVKITGIAGI